ncbi:hypothetical protein ACFV42_49670, partial [Streptomyces solisilvae]
MGRRTSRNKFQARAAEHRAQQAKPNTPRTGPTSRVMPTGSIQAAPAQVRYTRPKGIKLQPFSDVIPSTPRDYATVRADHVTQDTMVWARIDADTRKKCTASEEKCLANHGDKCIIGRVWENTIPDRQAMDFERIKMATRPSHESTMMATDRPSGAEKFHTYAQRHEDDSQAGLYRDGLGRIMRTADMDESTDGAVRATHDWRESDPTHLTCELTDTGRVRIMVVNGRTGERQPRGKVVVYGTEGVMTTTDYAQMHGVPI